MIWLTIGLITIITWIAWYVQKERNLSKQVPPGPLRLPIIGSFPTIIANPYRKTPFIMFQKLCDKYGSIMFLQLGINYQVVIDDYDTIRELLCSEVWVERFYDDWIAERAFGKELGVLLVSGPVWKEMRRFSIRTLRDFGFGKQKSMDATIQEELSELISNLNAQISSTNTKADVEISMHQFFTISILNVLWNMIAGFRFSHSDTKLQELLVLIDKVLKENSIGGSRGAAYTAFPVLTKIIPNLTSQGKNRAQLIETTHRFFREFLEQKRSEGNYKEEQRDFIDVFLAEIDSHAHLGSDQTINYYTDEQFLVLVKDLFMAGSETTSNTMEFAIMYMALFPDVQRKVQAEIDAVVGQNRTPNILDKPNMPYTEATLLEIQRMANVVPIIVRSPNTDTNIKQYSIPKGTIGIINLYSVHMNPNVWADPFNFNPNRFYDPLTNSVINSHKILPFGIGKRICLGEVLAKTTLFTYFTTFLQQFSFVWPGSQQLSSESKLKLMKPSVGFTLSPKPYKVIVKSRLG